MSKENAKIDSVQIEGLVALKIIKHCYEEGTRDVAQGVLLGLLVDKKLEITNCFPYPEGDNEEYDNMGYQMEMMRKLRDVNVDHFHVGWYQSTFLSSFLTGPFVTSQFNYQASINESVVLNYDPLQTHQGILSFKAYRLTAQLMELYKQGEAKFTPDGLTSMGISYNNLLEEVPVVIRNSNLVNALICEIQQKSPLPEKDSYLSLATASYLLKSVHLLIEGVDNLCQDAQKLHNYQRNNTRLLQAIDNHKKDRQEENEARLARGEPPLPEEDINKLFRPLPVPSRFDSLLMASQIDTYCEQLKEYGSQSFAKLFVTESIQKADE